MVSHAVEAVFRPDIERASRGSAIAHPVNQKRATRSSVFPTSPHTSPNKSLTTASCVLQTRSASQCQGMETTFYEDSRYGREVRGTKRPMTLDLNSGRSSKKPRGNSLLTSPDLQMLKIESPELEKLIIQQHGIQQQNQCMYPKGDDRDPYPRDFPDALGPPTSNYNLYHPQQDVIAVMPPSTTAMPSSSSMVDTYGYQPQHQPHHQPPPPPCTTAHNNQPMYAPYYGLEPLVSIKEEPQTVPCASSPPRSPIDMEDQERLKLERKRLRNRIAASKCRRRKLERIARLEDKVAHLKSENSELATHVTRLKEHVCQLKQQVMEHVRSGCEILVAPYPQYAEEL